MGADTKREDKLILESCVEGDNANRLLETSKWQKREGEEERLLTSRDNGRQIQ